MSDGNGINEALRREIDQIWARLGDATHYQVLGLDPSASRQAILEARAAIIRKLSVPAGTLPRAYTPRINVILRAAELAFAALADPVQRLNYDRTLPRGSVAPARTSQVMGERGSSVPLRPSQVGVERTAVVPAEPVHQLSRAERAQEVFSQGLNPWEKTPLPQQLSRADRAQEVFSQGLNPWEKTPLPQSVMKKTPPPGTLQAVAPIAPAPVAERPAAVIPPPFKRTAEMMSPFAQGGSESTVPAAPANDRPAANPLRATMTGVFAEPSKLQADLDVLLQEIDRVTASVQLCVSQLAEVDGPRRAQFHGTFHALTSTRGVLATMMATREEAAGHWGRRREALAASREGEARRPLPHGPGGRRRAAGRHRPERRRDAHPARQRDHARAPERRPPPARRVALSPLRTRPSPPPSPCSATPR